MCKLQKITQQNNPREPIIIFEKGNKLTCTLQQITLKSKPSETVIISKRALEKPHEHNKISV